MNLYPDIYLKNVKEITIELLRKHEIKGLILDIDNTLIDYDKKILDGAKEWCDNLKRQGIKMCILSNTNKVQKVKKVADALDLKYEYFAHKPSKKGFKKVKKLLQLETSNIAVVGDQIFTDVLGGNRSHMKTILTEPIDARDILITRIKRPFERIFINRYIKKGGK
jgi:HAD superfamily phosphatase (TIGR01668 family)